MKKLLLVCGFTAALLGLLVASRATDPAQALPPGQGGDSGSCFSCTSQCCRKDSSIGAQSCSHFYDDVTRTCFGCTTYGECNTPCC